MIKYIRHFILILSTILYLSGCITDYEAKGLKEEWGLLVVDGTISNDSSIIKLNRSIRLTDKFDDSEYINNAKIWIECDNGSQTDIGISQGKGIYMIKTGILLADTKYRIRITLDGEEFESEFLTPLFTPEIDSITYYKNGPGEPLDICVSTHDPLNQSKYYRWTYKEIWETKAPLFADARREPDNSIIFMDINTSNNLYYCWGYDTSNSLLLESSTQLKENIISNKKLIRIPCDHDKLFIMYYIDVAQMMIRKEAYEYFANLQKNIELTGSIFSPIPSEMHGNIKCTTNDLVVIGYIDVTTVTYHDKYISGNEGFYEPPFYECTTFETCTDVNLDIYKYDLGYFAPKKCVDCRLREKASKTKPENWPTPHL